MTQTTGPNAAQPDTNRPAGAETADAPAADTAPTPPQPSAAEGQEPAGAPAEGTVPTGHAAAEGDPAGSPPADGPETKEKNKIFETVRLKARLMMAEQELEKLRGEVEQLRAAPADYQERNMRLLADMENLRRRTERERADTAKFAITKFARDLLSVTDNFQRAIDTATQDAFVEDGPVKSFYDGVLLTNRELLNVLDRNGVKKIDPTGERFDPNLHQAMMQVDNAEVPSGTVVQTFQPAYMIEDRILRPAMVVVSRGGPKAPKPEDGSGTEAAPLHADSAPREGGMPPEWEAEPPKPDAKPEAGS